MSMTCSFRYLLKTSRVTWNDEKAFNEDYKNYTLKIKLKQSYISQSNFNLVLDKLFSRYWFRSLRERPWCRRGRCWRPRSRTCVCRGARASCREKLRTILNPWKICPEFFPSENPWWLQSVVRNFSYRCQPGKKYSYSIEAFVKQVCHLAKFRQGIDHCCVVETQL